jgi:hypothetical protein
MFGGVRSSAVKRRNEEVIDPCDELYRDNLATNRN